MYSILFAVLLASLFSPGCLVFSHEQCLPHKMCWRFRILQVRRGGRVSAPEMLPTNGLTIGRSIQRLILRGGSQRRTNSPSSNVLRGCENNDSTAGSLGCVSPFSAALRRAKSVGADDCRVDPSVQAQTEGTMHDTALLTVKSGSGLSVVDKDLHLPVRV